MEVLTAQALSMSLPAILHGLDVLEETLQKMRFGNQRALLEMAFVKLCDPQLTTRPRPSSGGWKPWSGAMCPLPQETAEAPAPAAAPPQREAPPKEEAAPAPKEETPAPQEAPPPPKEEPALPARKREEAPARPQSPGSRGRGGRGRPVPGRQALPGVPEVLQVVKGVTKSVAMAFAGSTAYLNGGLPAHPGPELAFELLKRPEQRRRIREAVKQVTGRGYNLGPYRPPAQQEDRDPLEELEQRAKEAGVALLEETPPQEDLPRGRGRPAPADRRPDPPFKFQSNQNQRRLAGKDGTPMKARLPQGYGGGGAANLQQLARQAQKMQEQMEAITAEPEEKEYTATSAETR